MLDNMAIPFKKIYLHGLVLDRHGQKMSKSHPETCIDPLEMIPKYGADALRLSLIIGATPGNDLRLYEEKIEGSRNFVNKVWNIGRFVIMTLQNDENSKSTSIDITQLSLSDKWILTKLQKLIEENTKSLENYRLSEAGERVYQFLKEELFYDLLYCF